MTDPAERKRYDRWLSSGIAMSYQQWVRLKDAVHTSMHWATPNLAGRMLNGDPKANEDEQEDGKKDTEPASTPRETSRQRDDVSII